MTHGVRSGSDMAGISYVGDHALPHMARFRGTVMQRFVSASEGGDRPMARRHNDFHVAIHEGPEGYLVLASRTARGLGQAMGDCSEMIADLRRGAAAATSHLSDRDLESLRGGIMWHERETLVMEIGRAARVA